MFDDLRGKNVVVTGAADGLGKVIAEQFIAAGSKVIVIARRETAWMRKTEKTQCQLLLSDIRDTDKVRAFLADLEDAGESVQVLVNNAGVLVERPLIDICDDDWDQTFDINLKATFQLCQLFANHMKNNEHCSIINAASFAAALPAAFSGVYAASKAALVSLTRSMAAEWAPYGIRVNAYSPGVIQTPMTLPKLEKHESEMLAAISMQRLGDPVEIANLVLFLASSASSYITGTNIDISGGKFAIQNPASAWGA